MKLGFRSPSMSLAAACLRCVVCIVGTLGPGGCVRRSYKGLFLRLEMGSVHL
jgi:hypothetical protein